MFPLLSGYGWARKLAGPLNEVSKRVMSGVAVPGAAAAGLPIQQADADLASWQISERLGEKADRNLWQQAAPKTFRQIALRPTSPRQT